jgi:hypothetical protein
MRLMKHAWEKVDLDGNGALTQEELRKTATSLLGHMTELEFLRFWAMVQRNVAAEQVEYMDFLNGMATAAADPKFKGKFATLNPNQLLTVLIDIPVMAKEEKMMLKSLSGVERFCVNYLSRKSADRSATNEAAASGASSLRSRDEEVLARVAEGTVHMLTDTQRKEVRHEVVTLISLSALCGFLSPLACALCENVATIAFNTNGVTNPDTDELSSPAEIMWFGAQADTSAAFTAPVTAL